MVEPTYMAMDSVKKSIWCGILEQAYGKDCKLRVTMKFKDGGLCNGDPIPTGKLKVPRNMLPEKIFNGTIQLDCETRTGAVTGIIIK